MPKSSPTPPSIFLSRLNSKYPTLWREADAVRALHCKKGTNIPDWDSSIFLPAWLWQEIFIRLLGRQPNFQEIHDYVLAKCIGAWRPSQDIIKFDDAIYNTLAETSLEGAIPTEVLCRLPAWCIYIETLGLYMQTFQWHGFFAMLDQVQDKKQLILHFLEKNAEQTLPINFDINSANIEEAIKDWENTILKTAQIAIPKVDMQKLPDSMRPNVVNEVKVAINLLLYICAYGISGNGLSHHKAVTPAYPAPKKVKGGWRLFPPNAPRIHEIGTELGEQIRKAVAADARPVSLASSLGAHRESPRPHIRRAHWHGFWSGPRKETVGKEDIRRFDVRWMPPIAVAMREDEEES